MGREPPLLLSTGALVLVASVLPAIEVWLGKNLIDSVTAHAAAVSTVVALGLVFGLQTDVDTSAMPEFTILR